MSQRSHTSLSNPTSAVSQPSMVPSGLTTRAINSGVDAILGLHDQRQTKGMNYSTRRHDEEETDADSPSPILDSFLQARGPAVVTNLTNFSLSECNFLWSEVRTHVNKHWNVGSGRKSKTTAKDMLFILLTTLKHGGSRDIMATLFKFNSSTLSKSIIGFLQVLHPCLMLRFVHGLADKWTMLRLATTGNQFTSFPAARYAVDVTFQQTNAPAGSFAAKKVYYSKKHGLYGQNVEGLVLPNGFAVGVSPSAKGSISDITIFESNEDFHRSMLAKQADESNIFDDGPFDSLASPEHAPQVILLHVTQATSTCQVDLHSHQTRSMTSAHRSLLSCH